MSSLANKKCKPCEGGVAALTREEAIALLQTVDGGWSLDAEAKSIEREFRFSVYSRTLAFANAIAWIATNEGHHPVLQVRYGQCVVTYSTTAVKGLSENDFICAAKIDRLAQEL